MIDGKTEELASLYVLDLLTREERAAFEARMRSDEALGQFVRELSSSLHAPLKEQLAPARPDLFEGIRERIDLQGSIPARPAEVPGPFRRESVLPFWATFWAVAAGILLLLNLSLLFVLNRETERNRLDGFAQGKVERTHAGEDLNRDNGLESPEGTLNAEISRLQDLLEEKESALGEALASRDVLAGEVEEARSFNAGWQREYARLAARVLPFFEPNDGMSRFTVIEMVDAEAYAREEPRLGFNELASLYLTGESNIGGTGVDAFVGPVAEGAEDPSDVIQLGQAGLTPIARGDTPASGVQGESGSPLPGQELSEDSDLGSRPAGFTVWRDDEQKGFLDLYNLPEPAQGEQAYLWVRSGDLDPYLPVGELPELENGTGSLFYSIDESNYTPTEILITSERPGEVGEDPSDSILLRGP